MAMKYKAIFFERDVVISKIEVFGVLPEITVLDEEVISLSITDAEESFNYEIVVPEKRSIFTLNNQMNNTLFYRLSHRRN